MSTKPTHYAYTVREGNEADQSYWTKIGAAFSHKDGKGFSLVLDALPVDGRLTLRKAEPKPEAKPDAAPARTRR